jgi:hypothetical protein
VRAGVDELVAVGRAAAEEPAFDRGLEVAAAIHAANQPGLSSAGVQAVFLEHARALGFTDESRGCSPAS